MKSFPHRFLRHSAVVLGMLCLIGNLTGTCLAASFERKDRRVLAAEADTIVVGRIREQQSRRLPAGLIVTDFTIEVDQRIKGSGTGPTEVITMAGGTVGAESQDIVGFPKLIAGAKYVLFIGRQRAAVVPFVGGHQGLYRVERDPETQEDVVADASGIRIAEEAAAASGPGPEAAGKAGRRGRLRLIDFVSDIRQSLER
jgi:hypothetical protein